jgi:hypothetical protein
MPIFWSEYIHAIFWADYYHAKSLVWIFSRHIFDRIIFTLKFWSEYFHANILVWIYSCHNFGRIIFTLKVGLNIFTPIFWSAGYFHANILFVYFHANILVWIYSRHILVRTFSLQYFGQLDIFTQIFWSQYFHANILVWIYSRHILVWIYSRQKIGLNIFHGCIGCTFSYNCHQLWFSTLANKFLLYLHYL